LRAAAVSGIEALGELSAGIAARGGLVFIKRSQQAFADAWRGMLHLAPVKGAVTVVWLAGGSAAVSEFGPGRNGTRSSRSCGASGARPARPHHYQ
jgi:hypothetical protein